MEKLPSVHQNLNVSLSECDFVHLLKGEVISEGTIVRPLNSDNLEAQLKRAGEEEFRRVVLNVDHLHYDDVTDTGFCFGDMVHDYSELKEK